VRLGNPRTFGSGSMSIKVPHLIPADAGPKAPPVVVPGIFPAPIVLLVAPLAQLGIVLQPVAAPVSPVASFLATSAVFHHRSIDKNSARPPPLPIANLCVTFYGIPRNQFGQRFQAEDL